MCQQHSNMKISMYMLEHWLGNLVSASNIQSGTRTIRTARLFTDDCQIENDILYVGRTLDFFPSAISKEVMMIHGNDILSVTSTDIRDTFNQVLSAFDRYNDMEQEMISGIFKPHPEQCILSACEEFLGPSFILSTDYRTIACSQNYNDQYVNPFWRTIVHSGDLPLELIMQMRNSVSHVLSLGTPHMIRFIEKHAAPYSHGLICTYWGPEKQVFGHMILANTQQISKFEEDIAQIILYHLHLIQSSSRHTPEIIRYRNADDVLLSNLLAGKELQEVQSHMRKNHGITQNHHFRIAVCKHFNTPLRDYVRKQIQSQILSSICICREDELIMFSWYTQQEQFPFSILTAIASQTETVWGISNPYADLTKTNWFYEQAHFSYQTNDNMILVFSQIAIDYLLNQKIGECRYYARHPLVLYLENSEIETKKELLETLKEYLLCERSVKRASEKLFVHRNTVTYRIDQIKQLNLVDFENEYERQYVLLSLLLP